MQPTPDYTITKEEHHWTSDEKLKFCGYGEWVEEPDIVHLEYLGYESIIMRVLKRETFSKEEAYFGGHLCGYVRIPNEHPGYRQDFRNEAIALDCHGGITFNEPHEQHWIGFDCSHMGDIIPTMDQMKIHLPELRISLELKKFDLFSPKYRNVQFCIDECVSIIDQLVYIASHAVVKRVPWPVKDGDEK